MVVRLVIYFFLEEENNGYLAALNMRTKIQIVYTILTMIEFISTHIVWKLCIDFPIITTEAYKTLNKQGVVIMKINIGENLKKLRLSKDLTQEQLAEVFGVSPHLEFVVSLIRKHR